METFPLQEALLTPRDAAYAGGVSHKRLANRIDRYGLFADQRKGSGRAMLLRFPDCLRISMIKELSDMGLEPSGTCKFVDQSNLIDALLTDGMFRFTFEDGQIVQKSYYPRAFVTVPLDCIHEETLDRLVENWDFPWYDIHKMKADWLSGLERARGW